MVKHNRPADPAVLPVDIADDPVGRDAAVHAALDVLRDAMGGAAARNGRVLRTLVLLWVTEDPVPGDGVCGCVFNGDAGPEVMDLMVETLLDDSHDQDMAQMRRAVQ